MAKSSNILNDLILPWLVTLLVPIALILGAVWLVLHPWFVNFEYHTPNFPADTFGFSQQDRIRYGNLALNYLMNNAGKDYLGDLRFPDGQTTPPESCIYNQMTDCNKMYNDRELQHMVDVKRTVQAVLRVFYIDLVALFLVGIWAWQAHWLAKYWRGLLRGGFLTLILIVIILLFSFLAFETFFTDFHNVFFAPGTWTFLYSDTLIRLFPERFWQDTFTMVGSLAAAAGIALGIGMIFVGKRTSKRV